MESRVFSSESLYLPCKIRAFGDLNEAEDVVLNLHREVENLIILIRFDNQLVKVGS